MRAYGDTVDGEYEVPLTDVQLWCNEDDSRRLHAYFGVVLEHQTFKGKHWHVHFRHHDPMWWEEQLNPDVTIIFEGDDR